MLFIEIFGWIGSVLVVLAYALITSNKLHSRSWVYQSMNTVGAIALLLNAVAHGALPSAAVNIVWLVIGGVGLVTILRSAKPAGVHDPFEES